MTNKPINTARDDRTVSRRDDSGDLTGSLEEFGLSKYEARAYLTMIGKGSLAASEIAYYANLPRTKIYQTLKKLEKKRLAVVSKQKPLICSAIPPEEAFGEIVGLHERRLKNMRQLVEQLQKINDEGQRPKGSEERRYFILDAQSALAKIAELISAARDSVSAALDDWGIRLVSQCRPALVRALTNGVHVRFMLSSQCVGSEYIFSLPDNIELRGGNFSSNLIAIDSVQMVSVDSSNGKAALFSSTDSYGLGQLRGFEESWNAAAEVGFLLDTQPATAARAVALARAVENGLSATMLEYAIAGKEMPDELADIMERKYELRLSEINPAEMISAVDSALKLTCTGWLKQDKTNNTLSLQPREDRKHMLPWALLLSAYFKRLGCEPRLMQLAGSHASASQAIHLKLAKAPPLAPPAQV
ncbi:MAG: helix-turn-helix domain-containing protein [Nitrososphaera sp.]